MIELCAIPPVRFASQAAKWLATGMKVGFGRSGSCWVCRWMPPPSERLGTSEIALSSVCMQSTMIVRRDQPRGEIVRSSRSGWRAIVPSSFSGRVTRVPSPTISV